MWVNKQTVFVVLLTLIVKSHLHGVSNYLDIEGYTIDNPSKLTRVTLESSRRLNEDPRCRSMKIIKNFGENVQILRSKYLSDLPNLEQLHLRFINLEEIEIGAFKDVPKLTIVLVVHSQLKEIKEGVFNGLNLVEVNLIFNQISTIASRAFDDMPKLERIDLRWNFLTRWDRHWFANTPKLKFIVFDNNNIEELPEGAFGNVKNENVSVLLKRNKIRRLGRGLFGGTKRVKELSLARNQIEDFSEHVLDGVEEMHSLILDLNKIECVFGNFSRIFVAERTFMFYNPFRCDCFKNVTKWERENQENGNPAHVYWIIMNKKCI